MPQSNHTADVLVRKLLSEFHLTSGEQDAILAELSSVLGREFHMADLWRDLPHLYADLLKVDAEAAAIRSEALTSESEHQADRLVQAEIAGKAFRERIKTLIDRGPPSTGRAVSRRGG